MNFQMFKLDLEKAEEPEIKLPTSFGSSKKQEFQKNIYFCFIDYAKDFELNVLKMPKYIQIHNEVIQWKEKIIFSNKRCSNNCVSDVQAGFRKGRGIRDQTANICWIIKKARVPEKHLFLIY